MGIILNIQFDDLFNLPHTGKVQGQLVCSVSLPDYTVGRFTARIAGHTGGSVRMGE